MDSEILFDLTLVFVLFTAALKASAFLGERYYVTFALSRLSVCLSLRNIVAAYSEG